MTRRFALFVVAGPFVVVAQNSPRSILGTVTGFNVSKAEIQLKTDRGEAVSVAVGPATAVERVAPGEKDLKGAQPAEISAIAVGDRALVSFVPGETEARRILVMTVGDIQARKDGARKEWIDRGVSGVVAAKKDGEIILRMRSLIGETSATVTVGAKTIYRRFAPDSVLFADAKPSKPSEIAVGDQLRAKGQKSADGLKVNAEEVVFGTFLIKAGSITSVNGNEITIKDLATEKPLVVKLTADSQIKRMPDFRAMMGGARDGGLGGGGIMRGGPPDLTQVIERMPSAAPEDLKPGDSIVVSSTKGAKSGEITAIMLVGNADMLIQMAQRTAGGGPSGAMGGPGAGMGMSGGLAGLDLGGMIF